MSLSSRIAKLELRRKQAGAAPCSACKRRRSPDENEAAAQVAEQWQSIYEGVFDKPEQVSVAVESTNCRKCGRCAIGFADVAEAYFLANQEAA